jgi:membrane protein
VPKKPISFKERIIALRDILKLMWSDMTRLDILKQSSAMAYVTLISIVPSLAAVFTIISIFKPLLGGGSKVSDTIKQFVIQNLAEGTGSAVSDTLDKLISNLSLTQIGVTSFASLLISLILLLRQIEQALNRIWMVRQERSMITRFVYFWTILTLGTFLVSLLFGYLSTFGLTNFMAEMKGQKSDIFHDIIGYVTSIVGGFSIFFFIYKVIPNTEVKIKDAAIGALFSAVALGIAGDFFSYYVKYFSKNSVLYGAIGALPLFLTWLYICWLIIMIGALITWRFEQGFKIEKEENELFKPTSLDSLYDQKNLECFIPNVCLILVYEAFWNESKGGLKFEEIQEKIHVPSTWIRDSLDLLVEKKYITLAQTNNSTEYIATRPPEKISISELKADFMPKLESKIYGWASLMDIKLAKKAQMILKNESEKTMLASLL